MLCFHGPLLYEAKVGSFITSDIKFCVNTIGELSLMMMNLVRIVQNRTGDPYTCEGYTLRLNQTNPPSTVIIL